MNIPFQKYLTVLPRFPFTIDPGTKYYVKIEVNAYYHVFHLVEKIYAWKKLKHFQSTIKSCETKLIKKIALM